MPFTISHVAAALPVDRLVGRQLPLVALAVGAMSPDLEFFVRGRIERTIGHTAHGAVLLDVPLGLLFLAALTWLVIPAIGALLSPRNGHLGLALQRSLGIPARAWRDPRSLARIVLALLIGAGSHIVWDVFTQPAATDPTGVRYRSLAWLDRFPFSIGEADFALHSVLHWVSTALGLLAVMIALDRWIERHPPPAEAVGAPQPGPAITRRAGWVVVIGATAGFLVQHPVALLDDGPARPAGLSAVLATGAVWALSGCFVGLAVFGALLRFGVLPTGAAVLPRPPDPSVAVKPEPLRNPSVKAGPLGPRSGRPRG